MNVQITVNGITTNVSCAPDPAAIAKGHAPATLTPQQWVQLVEAIVAAIISALFPSPAPAGTAPGTARQIH